MKVNPGASRGFKPSLRIGIGAGITLFALAIGAMYFFSRLQWIPAGHVGVIYNAQRGLSKNVIRPRAVFVGPLDQLYTYPTMLQNAVYTQETSIGEVKAADGILITTSDNANTIFDISILYRVKEQDVIKVFNTYGATKIETIQSQHIRRAVRDVASEIGSRYDVFQLIGEKRIEASNNFTKRLDARLASKGITVERAMILGTHPSNDMLQKINSRVNGYTMLEISQLQGQIAQINKEIAVTQADAELRAKQIAASKTDSKSIALLKIDLEELAVERWNGALPRYPQGSNTNLFLSPGGATAPQAAAGAKK